MCHEAGDPEGTYVSFVLMIMLIVVIIIKNNRWINPGRDTHSG